MFLKVDNVSAERMSSERLFLATGPATQNARLPNCSLVLEAIQTNHMACTYHVTMVYHVASFSNDHG